MMKQLKSNKHVECLVELHQLVASSEMREAIHVAQWKVAGL